MTMDKLKTQRQYISIQATPDISGIRTSELVGVDHTIVPCIALVEGVLWSANSAHPELALAEEFARFPDGWNNCPIVMNHPQKDDKPVSAGDPEIMENSAFGQVFNTKLIDNTKLYMELWINNDRVKTLGGEVQETVDRLIAGQEMVEVSTGLFTMSEQVSGEFDGQEYDAIWRNIVPDHLALLSQGTLGACSVEGGCGAPRTNSIKPAMQAVVLDTFESGDDAMLLDGTCECGGTCNKCSKLTSNEQKGLMDWFKGQLKSEWVAEFLGNKKHKKMSDGDIRAAIALALNVTEEEFTWVVAIFQGEEGTGEVVYEQGFSGAMFRRNFSIADKGAVSLGKNTTAVRPEIQFVPVEVSVNVGTSKSPSAQENGMSKEERVAALIANKATKFGSDNEAFLMGLNESDLELLEPVEAAPADELNVDNMGEHADGNQAGDIAPGNEENAVLSMEQHLDSMPTQMRSLMKSGLKLQEAQKVTLITAIKANVGNKFTDTQLDGFDNEFLESLTSLGHVVPDYSGQALGAGEIRENAGSEDNFAAAPSTIARPVSAAA